MFFYHFRALAGWVEFPRNLTMWRVLLLHLRTYNLHWDCNHLNWCSACTRTQCYHTIANICRNEWVFAVKHFWQWLWFIIEWLSWGETVQNTYSFETQRPCKSHKTKFLLSSVQKQIWDQDLHKCVEQFFCVYSEQVAWQWLRDCICSHPTHSYQLGLFTPGGYVSCMFRSLMRLLAIA